MNERKQKIWAEDITDILYGETAEFSYAFLFAILLSGQRGVSMNIDTMRNGLKNMEMDASDQRIICHFANVYYALRESPVGLMADSYFDNKLDIRPHITMDDFTLLIESWTAELSPYLRAYPSPTS